MADPLLEGVLVTPSTPARGGPLLVRGAVVLGVLFVVEAAAACPVCFSAANEENRTAFMLMTGFLTVLPLVLIGLAVRWYVRRVKAFERQNRAQRRAARRGRRPGREHGRVVNAPEGYFERGYAGTPRGR
ncbi:MAG TPA: hypothetical protein VFU02_11380 [Polyangiaceae bacterium]|nr:hypothetical protein [Polyangiaceae bacterium]